jgi:phospholipid N-methyltransferase
MMTSLADLSDARVVVEYGPGTGSVTPHILRALRPGATFLAIELDRVLCEVFRRRFPDVAIYRESAVNVGACLADHGVSSADCIISGLPWAAFGRKLQNELLDSTLAVLSDGGRLVTFAYWHASRLWSARMLRRALYKHFSSVSISPVVWRNLPPAFVYCCVK